MNFKTGIELIQQERFEQLTKHGRTIDKDVAENANQELFKGAVALLTSDCSKFSDKWDKDVCAYMLLKSYSERLVIAGALLAAELDRLRAMENRTNPSPPQ
jgi:hypothetical protein